MGLGLFTVVNLKIFSYIKNLARLFNKFYLKVLTRIFPHCFSSSLSAYLLRKASYICQQNKLC